MSLENLQFLRGKIEDLCKLGMFRPDPNPDVGSAVFVVPKAPGKYRMVVDLRELNKYTLKTTLHLPNLDNQLQIIQRASHFSTYDVLSGFDHLSVEADSSRYFSIVTPFGRYRMSVINRGGATVLRFKS